MASRGSRARISIDSALSLAAAVMSAAAAPVTSAGKSSLPRRRTVMLSKSIGQKGRLGRSNHRGVGSDHAAHPQHSSVEVDVVRQRHLNDPVDAVGSEIADAVEGIGRVERDDVRDAQLRRPGCVGQPADGADHRSSAPAGELRSEGTNPTAHTMDEHGRAIDRPVAEDDPMGSDARDTEACAHLVAHILGQCDGSIGRHHGELGGRAHRSVRLRAPHPHALACPASVSVGADLVDHTGAIAVRNDARKGHRAAKPAAALLGVTWVHAGEPHANAHLAWCRVGIGKIADPEDLVGGSLAVIPGCPHVLAPGVIPTPTSS